MKLEIYNNLLTKLLRKFPGEQRMCLTLIAIVAEARIVASSSNTMEINAILSSLDDLTMEADSVANFLTSDVASIIAANLDNPVFKNDFNIANDFIDAINKRFGLSYTKLEGEPVTEIEDGETITTEETSENVMENIDSGSSEDIDEEEESEEDDTDSTDGLENADKAKEEVPVIKVTSNHIPQENKTEEIPAPKPITGVSNKIEPKRYDNYKNKNRR